MNNQILWSEAGNQWASAVQKYFDLYSAIRHAPSTQELTERTLKAFTLWMRGQAPTVNAVEEWMVARVKGGASKATANQGLRMVRAAARWAMKRKYIAADPTEGLDEIPCRLAEEGRIISLEDAERLITWIGTRPRLLWLSDLVAVILETGCRVGELLWLRCQDVDLYGRSVTFRPREDWSPKDKQARVVPLTQAAYRTISTRIMSRIAGYVWCTRKGGRLAYRNVYRALETAGHKAGLPWVNFKSMRSLWATKAAESLTAHQLAIVMGHSAEYVTQKHYIHPKYVGITMPSIRRGP